MHKTNSHFIQIGKDIMGTETWSTEDLIQRSDITPPTICSSCLDWSAENWIQQTDVY